MLLERKYSARSLGVVKVERRGKDRFKQGVLGWTMTSTGPPAALLVLQSGMLWELVPEYIRPAGERGFAPQHIDLLLENQDLCLKPRSRAKQPSERRPQQPVIFEHRAGASPDSPQLANRIGFPTGTRVSARSLTR